jgi:molybdenum cofactor guanylyltransferase
MLMASAIILAGGQNRRMGRPKAALPFGNCTILERLIAELGTGFADIMIITAPEQSGAMPIEHLLPGPHSVRVLHDRIAYQGAAVALARGLAAAANEVAFVCSCDLPLLRIELAHALCGMLNGYEAVIPDVDGKPQPLCAVYRRCVAGSIEAQLRSGENRLTRVVTRLKSYSPGDLELRRIDPELYSFMNVNTREEYDRALVIAQLDKH